MTDDAVAFNHAFCPECGPVTECDEDRCCLTCGADIIVGEAFDKLMDEMQQLKETLFHAQQAVLTEGLARIKTEGELCAAREALTQEYEHQQDFLRVHHAFKSLFSSSPCSHAAALKEACRWITSMGDTKQMEAAMHAINKILKGKP